MLPVEVAKRIPLFEGFAPDELEDISGMFGAAAFEAGACLVRQGQPADSAFILGSGAADVITALPGGGEAAVASLAAGSMLGEMALLDCGVRSATVLARTPVQGYWIERDDFRALLAQRRPWAFELQRRITLTLCRRLRELNEKIASHGAHGDLLPPFPELPQAPLTRGRCAFDWRAFLPLLPAFRGFSAGELDDFAARVEALEAGRGASLFRQGDPANACHVILRGAVELSMTTGGARYRIGVLGPGRLCGVLALIERRAHGASAVAREDTVLLALPRADFTRIYEGHSRLAGRFHDAINRELLQALARTNNQLTRLISQARIRGGRRQMQQAEELQRMLGQQECSAA
jgi:CRP-like cAMP-binding protein